jgi:hypothetical protein
MGERLRIYSEDFPDILNVERLHRTLTKYPKVGYGPLLLPSEEYISSAEKAFGAMLETHFSSSVMTLEREALLKYSEFFKYSPLFGDQRQDVSCTRSGNQFLTLMPIRPQKRMAFPWLYYKRTWRSL